jgi:polysaccharide pyruvyl transferase WcaK-like protein
MNNQNYSFFSIKTQFENVGDALINREMIELAAKNSQVYVDLSRCPESFKNTLNLTSNNINLVSGSFALFHKMIMKSFNNNQAFYFLSPGGYLGEIEGKEFISKYINAGILFFLTKVFKVKICHIGVSYERIGSKFIKLLSRRSKLLHKHLLRDEISKSYADKNKIQNNGTMPDLAFNIFINEPNKVVNSKKICFSFRTDQYKDQFNDVKNFIINLSKKLPTDTKFKFFAQVERDVSNMQALTDIVNSFPDLNASFESSVRSLQECYSFYDDCDLIISNRLHVLLMGGSRAGRILPCVYGDHNMKIRGIMDSLGLTENVQDLSEIIDFNSLISLIDDTNTLNVQGHNKYTELNIVMANLYKVES